MYCNREKRNVPAPPAIILIDSDPPYHFIRYAILAGGYLEQLLKNRSISCLNTGSIDFR